MNECSRKMHRCTPCFLQRRPIRSSLVDMQKNLRRGPAKGASCARVLLTCYIDNLVCCSTKGSSPKDVSPSNPPVE